MKNRQKNRIRVEQLRRQIAQLERVRWCAGDGPVSSGCGPLNRLLPERGFRRGTLTEWLATGEGSGAGTLALGAATQACRDGGALGTVPIFPQGKWDCPPPQPGSCLSVAPMVVVDWQHEFYPPAAARLGIELQNLIVVHADDKVDHHWADHHWAVDQALRCRGVAAVLAWPEKLDGRTFRRWQLAAEQGGGLGFLVRPSAARHEPSWADVRLLVEPLPSGRLLSRERRRLRIHLLRCRGTARGRSIDVEIDDETHTMHPATRLANPTTRPRAAGA